MKPVEYMNGENFTENRGEIAATPPGAVHWTYRHTYILELAGRLAPRRDARGVGACGFHLHSGLPDPDP